MKNILPFIIIFMFSSCKVKDTDGLIKALNKNSKEVNTQDCPKTGTCVVEIFKNKDYSLEKDGIGKLYPKMFNSEDKTVIKYTYKKSNTNKYVDGNESEELLFVIDGNTKSSLKQTELSQIKLLFAKKCFCRDIQGYYQVEDGDFNIKSTKSESQISIQVRIPKLGERQVLKNIQFSIK